MNHTESILEAVKTGDTARVKELLDHDPRLANARNERGDSPVLLAAYYGRKELLKLLLSSGAELNLYEAATVGALDRVRALVAKDSAIVNSYSGDGFPPLSLAAFFGHIEVVEFLLARGAEINAAAKNPMKVMPLHGAVAGRHTAIAEMLLARGADANARQQMGFTPLHEAANSGQEVLAKLLLAHGADVNAKADDGGTPLSLAVAKNHSAVVEILKHHGAKM